MSRALRALLLAFAMSALPGAPPALAAEPTVQELLDATDDLQRGAHSHAVVEMQVKTAAYERTLKMESWAEGTDRTLVRILEPAKEAGVTTLKVDENIWNYLPKIDRTMKVPAGMMGGSWMGSHFTNDDLVKDSRMSEDFVATITQKPGQGGAGWTIELVAKPDAAVVWGKVTLKLGADKLPVEARYFDERGNLVRTMTWANVQSVGTRRIPMEMTLTPADKPGEFTKIRYLSLDFDTAPPAGIFTLQALKP